MFPYGLKCSKRLIISKLNFKFQVQYVYIKVMLEIKKNNKYNCVFLIITCGVKVFVFTIMDQQINHFAFLRVYSMNVFPSHLTNYCV